MKRITAILLALSLLLGSSALAPAPVAAVDYSYNGGSFSMNSDGLGDGDLDVCFENQGDFTVAYNRQVIMNGVGIWGVALDLGFTDMGFNCFGANVQFTWEYNSSDPTCAATPGVAWVNDFGSGDTFKHIYYNQACANFQWTGGSTPIAYGWMDPESIAMHEVGHAFGMGHDAQSPRIMLLSTSCFWSRQVQYDATHTISQSDFNIGNLYPAIDKSGSFPQYISCIE